MDIADEPSHVDVDMSLAASRAAAAGLSLRDDGGHLVLTDGHMELDPGFSSHAARLRPDRLARELLVRAIKGKQRGSMRVLDATAGLGTDALLLAAAGHMVDLCEQDPVILALLDDALSRDYEDLRVADAASRMRIVSHDSVGWLACNVGAYDAVYLDPMFPARSKSAAVKKKFQLLHLLERPCANEEELLAAALASGARKIVVKRPLKGPCLAGRKPAYSLKGKAVRYDVVVPVF